MLTYMYWIEAVICYGGMFPFVSSHSNTVARVGQSVNMSWSIYQAFTDFKIYSTTYHKEKLKPNDSTVQFIVRGNQLLPATINTHTENGTRIQLSLNTSLEGRNLVSLTFRSVDVQDAGVYSLGTHVSDVSREMRTQLLIVLQKPSEPSISTTVADPVSGDPVNLTCSTTSRSLPLDRSLYQYTLNTSYTWRRNNRSVDRSVDDRVHVAGQVLAIDHVTKEDKGEYSCQSGEAGLLSDWSQGYTLNVLYGPIQIQFDDTGDKLEVEEGKPAAVRCSADCNPACTVTWWDISRQTVITGQGEAVLSIPAVDVSVSGLFTCHVNNTHGSASRNLTLDIQHGLEPRPSTVGVAVPVAVVPSVLIIIITAVAVICVCKRVKKGDRQHRSGARNMEDNESHIQLQPRQRLSAGVVVNIREAETDGSYEEMDVPLANVDDIVPVVAAYSIILTAVSVVVAAVAVLVFKDARHGHNVSKCGTYLTVVGDRLPSDATESPYAAINNEDMLSLHDYERLLREQCQIYTSFHPSTSSTQDLSTRCSLM